MPSYVEKIAENSGMLLERSLRDGIREFSIDVRSQEQLPAFDYDGLAAQLGIAPFKIGQGDSYRWFVVEKKTLKEVEKAKKLLQNASTSVFLSDLAKPGADIVSKLKDLEIVLPSEIMGENGELALPYQRVFYRAEGEKVQVAITVINHPELSRWHVYEYTP